MNKISEKAVWGELSPNSSDDYPPYSSMPTQPHMTICYKCSQIIPANSAFCPSCGIQLYFDCPKCKTKFLSVYSFCPKCGTDYKEHFHELENLRAEKQKVDEFNVLIDDTIRSTNEYIEGYEYLSQDAKEACIKKRDWQNGWEKVLNIIGILVWGTLPFWGYYSFYTGYPESSFWQSRTPLIITIIISGVIAIWYLIEFEIFKIYKLSDYTPWGCGVYPSSRAVDNLIFGKNTYWDDFRLYFGWDKESIDNFLIRSYRKKYDIERANNECEIATSLAESIEKIERAELIILVDKEIMKKPEFCEAREYLKRIIRKYIRYRRFMLVAWLLFLVLTFTSIGLDMEFMTTIILLIITMLLLSAWYCMMKIVFLGREKLYDTPLLKRYSKELDEILTINNNVLIEAYRELYHVPQHSVQYDWLDIKPIFSMEDGDFCRWTMKNIKYPEDAVRKHIEGEVIVNFVINKQGQVEDIKITQSAHSLLDSEVVRVISQSPQWSPGKFRDIQVPATYVHKHTFKV